MIRCDVIVLGVGGVGSAALMHLARHGVRAIGLDRFAPPHDRGSSHGQTRAIRQAYFEHPAYVPLLRRAYELWEELEAADERKLFHRVGVLEVGLPGGALIAGVRASASQHQLPVQNWTAEECRRNVPALRVADDADIVFEENAGYLEVERCVESHCRQARRHGAEIRREAAAAWETDGAGVRVTTDRNQYSAAALVLAAGPWASQLLLPLGLPLTVCRKHLHWYPAADADLTPAGGFPVFFVEDSADTFYYGFPQLDSRGVKVAEHSGVSDLVDDPLTADRGPDPRDTARVTGFVERRLPGLQAPPSDHACCYYTMTPDQHFVVDRLPDAPQVAVAAGLSGHGFKFATVLGETLAQLAQGQAPAAPAEFLSLARLR